MFLMNEEEEGNVVMENGNPRLRSPRKFWSVVDDSHLISAWLTTSKTGKGGFWDRITAFLNENHLIKDGPRNWKSCKNRWATITKGVVKFINTMARAREGATYDMSEPDLLIKASQLYRDDVKSDFHLSHAYELLQNEPKFLEAYVTEEADAAGAKRSRLNEVDDDHRLLDPSTPQILTLSLEEVDAWKELSFSEAEASSKRPRLDPSTPQVLTRSLDEVEPSVGSLGEQIRSSLQAFRETNEKMDVWKEVKMREMEIKVELRAKKMEQKNRDSRYKLFNTLLGKASLSEFEEALKNKLYAELFPE